MSFLARLFDLTETYFSGTTFAVGMDLFTWLAFGDETELTGVNSGLRRT